MKMRRHRSSCSEIRTCATKSVSFWTSWTTASGSCLFQRFGLDGGDPETLEVVGKKFGVTRELIRRLQNVALDKLRRALRKKETPQAAPVVATGAPLRLPLAKVA